jgi:hypothetical protein
MKSFISSILLKKRRFCHHPILPRRYLCAGIPPDEQVTSNYYDKDRDQDPYPHSDEKVFVKNLRHFSFSKGLKNAEASPCFVWSLPRTP